MTALADAEQGEFASALADVSVDGPRTKLGALKIKSLLSKIPMKDIRSALLDVVKQIGVTEAVKLVSGG